MRTTAGGRTALTGAFAGAARRYWLGVFPRVCAERRRREARAHEIPDPLLRRVASTRCASGATSRGRPRSRRSCPPPPGRGGAGDGVLSGGLQLPRHARRAARRRARGQRPAAAPRAARRARPRRGAPRLLRAPPPARRRRLPRGDRRRLPRGARRAAVLCRGRAGGAARGRADRRVPELQHRRGAGRLLALERWARAHTPPGTELRWWETAAAGGSSMCMYALIAAAARPAVDRGGRGAGGGLLPLDRGAALAARQPRRRRRGLRTGQHSLIGCYASPLEAAARMVSPGAALAASAARALPGGRAIRCCSRRWRASTSRPRRPLAPERAPVTEAVLAALDGPAELSMLVFRARLACGVCARAPGAPARRGGGAEVVMPRRSESSRGAPPPGGCHRAPVPPSHEAHGIK